MPKIHGTYTFILFLVNFFSGHPQIDF